MYLYKSSLLIRDFKIQKWSLINKRMLFFSFFRNKSTIDEIWIVEHYPVYTFGKNDKKSYLNSINHIPVFKSSRGGKITYHGPGQLLIYLLIDLKRSNISIKQFLSFIKKIMQQTLNGFSIYAKYNKNYPGLYVIKKKICSFGISIKNGCSMHGISLNIKMNLKPFMDICPCGLKDIEMTQMIFFNKFITVKKVKLLFIAKVLKFLRISNFYFFKNNIFC